MKIENQVIQVKKSVEIKRLMLSTLQYQYLAELQMGSTIFELVSNTPDAVGWSIFANSTVLFMNWLKANILKMKNCTIISI